MRIIRRNLLILNLRWVTEGIEVVFHLAADHGGRGCIDSHPVGAQPI